MRVTIVNTYDTEGGASRAAFRLHRGLIDIGVDSRFVVQQKRSDDAAIQGPSSAISYLLAPLRPMLDSIPLRCYPNRKRVIFSPAILPGPNRRNELAKADVVNLHWVTDGFMSVESIGRIARPTVWTLHDSWAFTGGCHVPFECERYTDQCGKCPQLQSSSVRDLSNRVWKRKYHSWMAKDITIVTDSNWLASRARRSSLFANTRIEVINPGLDLDVYRPMDKKACREILGLSADATLVLFGALGAASDKNKGLQFLRPALRLLSEQGRMPSAQLVVFGASRPREPEDFGFPTHYFGRLHDDLSLAILYSAADVMVVPSIQEAFGQTASEALACGTPVVAFGATGLLDIVDHQVNGYLARPYDVTDLAGAIWWVLSDSARWAGLSAAARRKCEQYFEFKAVARRYADLYAQVLANQ